LRDAGSKINLVQSLERIADFEVLYTDFTEIRYKKNRTKAFWMPVILHCGKVIVEHAMVRALIQSWHLKPRKKQSSC
jgi:hypothetical protein